MRNLFLSAAILSSLAMVTGCSAVTTAADHKRMDAYADMQNRAGARGAPTPDQMAAMGYFRAPDASAKDAGDTKTAYAAPSNVLANLRLLGK